MNIHSIRWAFKAGWQHCTEPSELLVLLVIASTVNEGHSSSVLSAAQLAEATLMTIEESQRHLTSLERLGLIRRGEESLAENFPRSEYPIVWDLLRAYREEALGLVRGRRLSRTPHAVYRFYDKLDRLLYIGCTIEPDVRFAAHKSKPWWPEVTRSVITWYECYGAAHIAEKEAISEEKPLYNIAIPKGRRPTMAAL